MKHQKLVRGVIYDNPNLIEEETFNTADVLSKVTDDVPYMESQCIPRIKQGYIPSTYEFMVPAIIDSITNTNMIIPKSLVNDKLYQNLKPIDIGNKLSEMYIGIRSDFDKDTLDYNINIQAVTTNGDILFDGTYDRNDKDTAINDVIEWYYKNFGNKDLDLLESMIRDIKAS